MLVWIVFVSYQISVDLFFCFVFFICGFDLYFLEHSLTVNLGASGAEQMSGSHADYCPTERSKKNKTKGLVGWQTQSSLFFFVSEIWWFVNHRSLFFFLFSDIDLIFGTKINHVKLMFLLHIKNLFLSGRCNFILETMTFGALIFSVKFFVKLIVLLIDY